MRRIGKNLIAAAVLATVGVNAHAWTITETGVLGNGYDTNNIFGTADPSNLTGNSFAVSINVDPNLYNSQCPPGSSCGNPANSSYAFGSYSGLASVLLTINGVTKSWTFDDRSFGQSFLWEAVGTNKALQYHQGHTNQSSYVYAYETVFNFTQSLGLTVDFNQSWSYIPQISDYQYFNLVQQLDTSPYYDLYANVYGGAHGGLGSVNCIAINSDACTSTNTNKVPEPASFSLLGLGIAGLAARRRRKAS